MTFRNLSTPVHHPLRLTISILNFKSFIQKHLHDTLPRVLFVSSPPLDKKMTRLVLGRHRKVVIECVQ